MKVFVIEDSPIISAMVGFMLHKSGVECSYHNRVDDALYAKVLEYEPDVVILELDLVDFDGVRVAERLHRYPKLYRTPIIAVSNSNDLFEKAMIKSHEFNDYMEKPFSREKLLPLVQRYGVLGKLFNTARKLVSKR